MREILFRGKRTNNGRWIEGYYMHHLNRMQSPLSDCIKPEDEDHIILYDGFADWNMPRDITYVHVDPETVGQYTGLRDKNGKRIFEGDVLRKAIASNGEMNIGVVSYADGVFGVTSQRGAYFLAFFENSEVIGNVHDNPELIGGKEDGT